MLHPVALLLLQLEQKQYRRNALAGDKRHSFLMSPSQRPELDPQRGVAGNPPRGIEPINIQRARRFLCQAWLDADCELFESLFTKVDAVEEYAT